MLNKLFSAIAVARRNPTQVVVAILACGTLFYAYGCESKTKSLIDNERKVTRAELKNEIESLLNTSIIRLEDLDRQDSIKKIIFEQSVIVAQGGIVNPLGVITSLMAILGIGAAVDDVRLRKQRKKDLANCITHENINDKPA